MVFIIPQRGCFLYGIKVTQGYDLGEKLRERYKKAENQVEKALLKGATDIERDAKISMRGPKSGKFYKTYNKKKKHRASAPGEAPAVDTGRLRSSIKYSLVASGKLAEVIIGSDVEYAKYLEMGTSKMEPRPFLQPALEKNREQIKKEVADAISKEIFGL